MIGPISVQLELEGTVLLMCIWFSVFPRVVRIASSGTITTWSRYERQDHKDLYLLRSVMLLSGPKSYYDDYVRKKDTSRTLHDPPSLLTDRGAYVNFLEVQLERVSAACLGVQSYDQRFNDMQSLIVSLEQRCASTTRLVGLAQQCTEELRNQTEEKIEKISENFKQEHWEVRNIVETMSMRIAAIEQTLGRLTVVERRLDESDKRFAECEAHMESAREINASNHKHVLSNVEKLESNQDRLDESVGALQTACSKLQFDLDESRTSLRQSIASSESRLMEVIEERAENSARNVHLATVRAAEATDKVQRDVITREAGCLAAVRLLGESLREEVRETQVDNKESLERLEEKMGEELSAEVLKINKRIMEHIEILQGDMETQTRLHAAFVENSRGQLKQLDRAIGSISQEQEEIYRSTCDLQQSLSCQQWSPGGRGRDQGDGRGAVVSFAASPPPVLYYSPASDASSYTGGNRADSGRSDSNGGGPRGGGSPPNTSSPVDGAEGQRGEEGDAPPVHVNADKAISACRARAQHRHLLKQQLTTSLPPQEYAAGKVDCSSTAPSSVPGWQEHGAVTGAHLGMQLQQHPTHSMQGGQQSHGMQGGQQSHGMQGGQQSHGMRSGQQSHGMQGGQQSHGMQGGQQSYGMQGGQQSHGMQGGQQSYGMQGGQQSHGMQGGQQSHGMQGGQQSHGMQGGQQSHSMQGGQQSHGMQGGQQSHGMRSGQQSYNYYAAESTPTDSRGLQQQAHARALSSGFQDHMATPNVAPNVVHGHALRSSNASHDTQASVSRQWHASTSGVNSTGTTTGTYHTGDNTTSRQEVRQQHYAQQYYNDTSLPPEDSAMLSRNEDDSRVLYEADVSRGYEESTSRNVSTMDNADDESMSSIGAKAKIRSTVTIQSPSRRHDESSNSSRAGSKQYIDYVGGGLYCNSQSSHDELGNRRAAALGLSYIGTGLYVDPSEAKGFTERKVGHIPPSTDHTRGMPADKKRKSNGGSSVGSSESRSVSPSRRAPPPPPARQMSRGEEDGSHSAQVRASTAAFDRFLQKYRGQGAPG